MPTSLLSRQPVNPTKRTRPAVEIHLDDQANARIPTFASLDTISGHVTFTAQVDTHFDQISIMLTGTSLTSIEQPGVATGTVGRSTAFHTFLRLMQPIDEEDEDYPHLNILEAGRTYTFPFMFVVPENLLQDTCNHEVKHQHVRGQHTQLPPSMGDPTITAAPAGSVQGGQQQQQQQLDDLAPEGVQIQYAIRASLTRAKKENSKEQRTVAEQVKRLRIVPSTEEHPPLDVSDNDDGYRLRNEKDVRKGALRTKQGRLVMSAAQPRPFRLPQLHSPQTSGTTGYDNEEEKKESSTTTTAMVHLRFDPTDEQQQPPRLGTLWTKLKTNTYYSTEAWDDLPASDSRLNHSADRRSHTQTLCLASRCVASASWKKHSPQDSTTPGGSTAASPASSAFPSRRCSMDSDSSLESTLSASSSSSGGAGTPTPSASYAGKTYFTTSVLVPVTLPKTKSFVPTFHSCLASRTYTLHLALAYHSKGSTTTFAAPHFSIHLPVQVMGPKPLNPVRARSGPGRRGAEEFFTPRTIRPPRPEYTERSTLDGTTTATNPAVSVGGPEGEEEEDNVVSSSVRRARSDTLSSMASSMRSHCSAPPPEYLFSRQMSNRRVMRTAG